MFGAVPVDATLAAERASPQLQGARLVVDRDWKPLVVRPRNRRYTPVEQRDMQTRVRTNQGRQPRHFVCYGRLMRQTQCSMKRPSANR